MTFGATIASIKTGLKTTYQAISFPGGLGYPTVINRELDGLPPSFPYVEIFTNPAEAVRKVRDEGSYETTRRFISRVSIALLPDDTPSIEDPDYIKAENCIEAIIDYFQLTDDRLNTAFVLNHEIRLDSAGVMLYTRANRNCVGIAFEHSILYYRSR